MIVMQILLALIHMLVVPYLIGELIMPTKRQNAQRRIWTLAAGIIADYALYECLALVFIWKNASFRLLSKVYAAAACALALAGICRMFIGRKNSQAEKNGEAFGQAKGKSLMQILFGNKEDQKPDLWFLAGIILILVQIGAILFWATPDKDDAFYSGLSSLCLMQDKLFQSDAYFGFLTRSVSRRYRFSALPAYQASLTLLSGKLHHLVITHDLFPLFYMPLAYALLYSIGKALLKDMRAQGQDGKLLFAIGLLHMIGNYFVFSPENFLVTRIWQGKALFVTIGIPCIWHFTGLAIRGKENADKKNLGAYLAGWLLPALSLIAVTFMGETGLYLGPFMMLAVCAAHTVCYRRWKQFIPAVICCIPEGLLLLAVLL